jgi:hypothetical protein
MRLCRLLFAPCSQTPFTYNNAAAGKVHSGFYLTLTDQDVDSYDSDKSRNNVSAYQELLAKIKSAQDAVGTGVPIILTGHSLVSTTVWHTTPSTALVSALWSRMRTGIFHHHTVRQFCIVLQHSTLGCGTAQHNTE